jgi:hypothetical protein
LSGTTGCQRLAYSTLLLLRADGLVDKRVFEHLCQRCCILTESASGYSATSATAIFFMASSAFSYLRRSRVSRTLTLASASRRFWSKNAGRGSAAGTFHERRERRIDYAAL